MVNQATRLPRDHDWPIVDAYETSSLMGKAQGPLANVTIVPSSAHDGGVEKLSRMLTGFAKGIEDQDIPTDAARRRHRSAQGTEARQDPGEKATRRKRWPWLAPC